MNGCEPFDEDQARRVTESMSGEWRVRDRAMLVLGMRTGFRISELLSLRVGDVYVEGQIVERVYVAAKAMKGTKAGKEGRAVVLHEEARAALAELVEDLQKRGRVTARDMLFRSGKTFTRPIHRSTAWRIIRRTARRCGIVGRIGTHTMRKTFASRMYDRLDGNIFKIQQAMGHKSVDSTTNYLAFRQEEIDAAILG